MRLKHPHNRDAVTLVEVMFSMGVILIGLVGLVSILPIAGRRAQDAIELNQGAALATAVFDELKSNGYLEPAGWAVRFDQVLTTGPFAGATVGGEFAVSASNPPAAWCIDPLFVSDTLSGRLESAGGALVPYSPTSGNGYRRMLFPYYKEEHNPLVDPSRPSSAATNWPTAAPLLSPRMMRVGLNGAGGGLMSSNQAQAVVDSTDGLATVETDDETLNVGMQGSQATKGGLVLGKHLSDGALTWIATCNVLPGTPYMSVSVVIVRNRDRSFFTYPVTDGLGGTEPPAGSPEDNAVEERLGYVSYATGFSGGAGGSVHIVGAANTSSSLVPNDWVMLSRETTAGPIHRWYRVAATSGDAETITVADPVHGVEREVWRRKAFLDGPDWSFGFPTPGASLTPPGPTDTTVTDNTYVTILEGVVSVSEHLVRVE